MHIVPPGWVGMKESSYAPEEIMASRVRFLWKTCLLILVLVEAWTLELTLRPDDSGGSGSPLRTVFWICCRWKIDSLLSSSRTVKWDDKSFLLRRFIINIYIHINKSQHFIIIIIQFLLFNSSCVSLLYSTLCAWSTPSPLTTWVVLAEAIIKLYKTFHFL